MWWNEHHGIQIGATSSAWAPGYAAVNSRSYVLYVNGKAWSSAWAGGSDKNLKTDCKRIENATSKVAQLTGYTFMWQPSANEYTDIVDEDKNPRRAAGVFSQDVDAVLPEAVTNTYYLSGEGYRGVDYTKIIPLLIEAINEQQAEIVELKARIDENNNG